MITLELNIPDNFILDENEAKMTLASRLYQKGKLTLGQAAVMVGLSKVAFMELLSFYDIEIINYPFEELESDLINAERYNI